MLTLDQDKQHLLVDLAAAELGGASGPTPEDLEERGPRNGQAAEGLSYQSHDGKGGYGQERK